LQRESDDIQPIKAAAMESSVLIVFARESPHKAPVARVVQS